MRAVLYVDDQEEELQALRFQLAASYRVLTCKDGETAATLVRARRPAAVILDVELPGYDGFRVLSDIRALPDPPPVIMLSGHADPIYVMRAIRLGAADYLPKPFTVAMLKRMLERHLGEDLSTEASRSCAEEPHSILLGESPAMRGLRDTLVRYARAEAPVLLLGETGTGKDLAARFVHARSHRAQGPFEVRNVAALPPTLAESELFGNEDGAYTDARSREGCFEAAHGGTLFLDEIAEANPCLQAALLRVVEEGLVRRLGATKTRRVDCRLVAATNRDVEGDDGARWLRRDLLYRLNALTVRMPPLRDRIEDIPLLVAHLLARTSRPDAFCTEAALDKLSAWSWPGNVRQLRSCLQRAAALSDGPELGPELMTP